MPNTTAFTTPCSRRRADFPRLLRLIGFVLSLIAWPVQAQTPARIAYGEIQREDADYVINADIDVTLNPRVEDAIRHGIAVYFLLDARIESPRWYWLDETVVSETLNYRITYHALTRSFRLAIGSFHQSFDNLDAAVRTMTRVRRWRVAGVDALEPGQSYKVALRFRLDTDLLPRPFKVSALGSRDWSIDTDWMNWTFLSAGVSAQ
ncbi:MAG: DUF4390 domain-containing protein [Proteobacteria bacterium]|nr:MAG: DUF4390 domain-containing protein [Pseudomonadota bacterium]